MTMPFERHRALCAARALLDAIVSQDAGHEDIFGGAVPDKLVRQAAAIRRHFPDGQELHDIGASVQPTTFWFARDPERQSDFDFGAKGGSNA